MDPEPLGEFVHCASGGSCFDQLIDLERRQALLRLTRTARFLRAPSGGAVVGIHRSSVRLLCNP